MALYLYRGEKKSRGLGYRLERPPITDIPRLPWLALL